MPNKSPIFGHSHFSTDLRAESRLFLLKLWHFGGACEIQMHEAQKHRKRGGWPGMALHGRYHMNWHSLAHLESGNMSRHFLMFFMNLLIMRQKQQKLIFDFFYSGVYNKILFWSMVACPYLTVAISLFPKNCFLRRPWSRVVVSQLAWEMDVIWTCSHVHANDVNALQSKEYHKMYPLVN